MEMFIADPHFGHENILKECRPQFHSIEEMDRTLIDNINRKMTREDTLYIIGDLAFRNRCPIMEYLNAIAPRKILILGNHEKDWMKHVSREALDSVLDGICEHYSFNRGGIEFHLQHFPQLAWNRSHYFAQSFSICGHIHNARNESVAAELFPLLKCQMNAGVDINHFEPVTFEELVANNTAFYGRSYTDEETKALERAIAAFSRGENRTAKNG